MIRNKKWCPTLSNALVNIIWYVSYSFWFYTWYCSASPHFLLDQLDYFVKFFSCYLLLCHYEELQGPVLLGVNANPQPGKIVYLQWMMALNNNFEVHKQNKLKLSLLNSFGSSQSSPEHLQTFSAMFRTLRKIVRNLFEVTDTFWFSESPVMTRWKSHTFDSEKVNTEV